MVSDKLIMILIIVSILLSTVSIVFTLSSSFALDKQIIPQINQEKIPDADRAQVSLIINPQSNTSTTP